MTGRSRDYPKETDVFIVLGDDFSLFEEEASVSRKLFVRLGVVMAEEHYRAEPLPPPIVQVVGAEAPDEHAAGL